MTETQIDRPALLDIDPVDHACAVAHMAAYSLIAQVAGVEAEEEGQDKERWYSLFLILSAEEQDDKADDLYQLAKYVCHRAENVSAEQLWRKAAEMGLHEQPADSFFEQPFEIRLAYKLFARTARVTFVEIEMEQREIASKLRPNGLERQPIAEDDRAIELESGPLDKDPVFAAAADAIATIPVAKTAMEDAAPVQEALDPQAAGTPMSIGEPPVKHSGAPKRGGARMPRNQKKN